MKKILILGGGAGGVVTANHLAKYLGKDRAEITLIDKNDKHYLQPSFVWVMTGNREEEDVSRPLSLLEKRGIRFLQEEVKELKPKENKVVTDKGEHEYDYLVVALGTELDWESLKGAEHVCAPWSMKGALKCREKISRFKGGNIVIGVSSWPYKCPPAPFEVAFLLKYQAEQRGIDDKTNITVFHQWEKPMQPFGPMMADAFQNFLNQYNIAFKANFHLDRVEEGKVIGKNGEELPFDLAVVVPPHKPASPVASSELANPEVGGYMKIDKKTLRHPEYQNVFGIGDVVAPSLNLGMAGVFAHFQGEYVATQIADELNGTFQGELYNMSGVCVMDLGYMGAAVYCDFSKKIMGTAEYPDCVMLGGMRAFRVIKIAFEKYWFARLFGR